MDLLLADNLVGIRELFGSAVKGTRKDGGDFDFIIRFPETVDYVTYANNYFSILCGLQKLLSTDVYLVIENTLKNKYLIESIEANKISVIAAIEITLPRYPFVIKSL